MRSILPYTFSLLFAWGVAHAATVITARDAWVREAPPGATVLAGYMTLENSSDRARALVSAQAKGFERVELHETILESGRAIMHPVSSLTIPPHGRISLTPGGYHLMLMRPERVFAKGSQVTLELKFADGDIIRVSAPVKSALSGDTHEHHH